MKIFKLVLLSCSTWFLLHIEIQAQESKVVTWYEGSHQRKIYMSTSKLVDLAPAIKPRIQELRTAQKVSSLSTKKSIKIYELSNADHETVLQKLKKQKNHRISPLFSESPHGPFDRALPGGAIVFFDNKLSDSELKKLAKQTGLNLLRKLNFSKQQIWLIDTPPGPSTLEAITKLRKIKHIQNTLPNWWYQISPQ